MDIIESWVDESKVRSMAMQLATPLEQANPEDSEDDEFIILSPEEIFVEHQVSSQNKMRGDNSAKASTNPSPIAQTNAIKSLKQAAQKASQSGVISNRLTKIAGLNEQKGWAKNSDVSTELQQHLGDSAGALLNKNAVTSSLGTIVEYIRTDWASSEVSISDRDGDLFIDTMRCPAWSQLTISVTEPIRLLDIKQGTIGHGYIHLKVTAKEFLQVVVTSTSHGLLIIGIIREKQLNAQEAQTLVKRVRELV